MVPGSKGYRADLDGLRAIAVLSVILFHADIKLFEGGFVGVDIFLVISGFLITRLILDDLKTGSFSLASFYERRARRILPALFLVIIVCAPFAWFWMTPADFREFSWTVAASATFSSNIYFYFNSDYFDIGSDVRPLLHTWSLGIEEQYYLLFPGLFILVWKGGVRMAFAAIAALALGSLYLSYASWPDHAEAGFYLMPARIWEILIGSLCAFAGRPVSGMAAQAGQAAGLLMIGAAVFAFDETTPFPALYALLPVLGTASMIVCGASGGPLGKLLGSPPMVGIGLISYSAYLWHQPLFAFARIKLAASPDWPVMTGLVAATFFLAWLTWTCVERPFRTRSPGRALKATGTLILAAGLTSLIAAAGVAGALTSFQQRHFVNNLSQEDQRLARLIDDMTNYDLYDAMRGDADCNFWVRDPAEIEAARLDACERRYGPAIIVLGDSHAMNIYNMLYAGRFADFLVGISQGGCRPHDSPGSCHIERSAVFLAANRKRIRTVYYHQSGSHLMRDERSSNDTYDIFNPALTADMDGENIELVIEYLTLLARDNDVVWLGPFVEARVDFRNLDLVRRSGLVIPDHNFVLFDRLETAIVTRLDEEPRSFTYHSLLDSLEITESSLLIDGCLTYRDGDHFSRCGEDLFSTRLVRGLRAAPDPAP